MVETPAAMSKSLILLRDVTMTTVSAVVDFSSRRSVARYGDFGGVFSVDTMGSQNRAKVVPRVSPEQTTGDSVDLCFVAHGGVVVVPQ